jgi:hypothetical protein
MLLTRRNFCGHIQGDDSESLTKPAAPSDWAPLTAYMIASTCFSSTSVRMDWAVFAVVYDASIVSFDQVHCV